MPRHPHHHRHRHRHRRHHHLPDPASSYQTTNQQYSLKKRKYSCESRRSLYVNFLFFSPLKKTAIHNCTSSIPVSPQSLRRPSHSITLATLRHFLGQLHPLTPPLNIQDPHAVNEASHCLSLHHNPRYRYTGSWQQCFLHLLLLNTCFFYSRTIRCKAMLPTNNNN
ncbi:hypothetical protein E2C01_090670 [Portunus trituberculatus]|uniref:Uncharacterized protein n=1 Tax=Portunus trituberculatus TaxID=210409 RepID=A0A5B7JR05_PORTR|nr:hypothetical protein [Portunus trituberculatus]